MNEEESNKKNFNIRSFIIGFLIGVFLLVSFTVGAVADRLYGLKPLDRFFSQEVEVPGGGTINQKILTEESVVIDVTGAVSESVVTVTIVTPQRRVLEFSPYGGFQSRIEGGTPLDIGSGFVVSTDGLIITNKHVVDAENAEYKVVTKDDQEYEVKEISKDPSNDIAILKIEAAGLKPVDLGDSDSLKVGQFVIAIGTALGEFRHTVTTGVISGLGRGITAGSSFEGFVERIDDVIQTDAAINPGNSGGPLLNSAGQVIGVNVAVASGAENIGFAIPINIVKKGLEQFEKTGKFISKPFLGVRYQLISKSSAILNEVPEGAYVIEVVEGSPAESAEIKLDDIITEIAGRKISEDGEDLADIITSKSPGDVVEIKIWRSGEEISLSATLSEFSE